MASGAAENESFLHIRVGYIGCAFLAASAASAGQLYDARRLAIRAPEEREGSLVYWRGLADWAAFRADAEYVEIMEQAGL